METIIITALIILIVISIESSFDEALEATIKTVAPDKLVKKIESNKYFVKISKVADLYSIVSTVVAIALIA